MARIVCLHGLGCNSASFGALAEHLSDHELVCLDFSGHPARLLDEYVGSPLAFGCNECCETARGGSGDVVLVGHSMGGTVASLASRVSDRVSALVLIESNLTRNCGKMSRILAAARTDKEFSEARDGLIRVAQSYNRLSWDRWAQGVQRMRPQVLKDYAAALVELSDSGTAMEAFQAFTGRKCFTYGDTYIGHPVLPEVPARLRAHVQDAHHFVMEDEPEACAAIVRAALSRRATDGRSDILKRRCPPGLRAYWQSSPSSVCNHSLCV